MKIKTIALISFSALLFADKLKAQESDTVKTVTTKEQTVVHDTVVKTIPPPPPAVIPPPADDAPPFHALELGVRYMPTFSSISIRTYNGEVTQGEVAMSNGYGLMLSLNGKHIGLQGEIDYLQISQKYKDRNLDRSIDVSYLNIPVLLSLNTDKSKMVNLNVVAGPQFGLNVGAKTSANGGESTDTLRAVIAVKKGDVGLAYGAGLEFMVNKMRTVRIDLGLRGYYGLVDMGVKSTNDPNTYNVVFNASRKAYGGYLGLTFLF